MEFCARRDGSRIYPRHRRVRRVGENRRGHHGAHFESTGTSSSRRTFRIDGDFVITRRGGPFRGAISNRRGLHVPNERWRGPDEAVFWFFCRRSFFFFWCFFNAVTSVCASSSFVSSNRSRRRLWRVRGRPAGATRVRTRARVDATHASAPRSRIVWSYSSWSVRHRSTASDAGRGPASMSPTPARDAGGTPREQPQDGADDRTSRSIHRPRPFLSSASGRSSFRGRRRRIRNKSIRRRPLWSRSRRRRRVFARLLVSRRRRSYFSSSSSRWRRARCPSIGAPPRRPSSGVQVPNPVLSVCYI